jgi:hypothetical protein
MLRGSMIRKFDRISVEEEIGIGLDGFRAVGVRRFQAPTWPNANAYIPAKPYPPIVLPPPGFNQPGQRITTGIVARILTMGVILTKFLIPNIW